MDFRSTSHRRWFGGIVLVGAIVMLICGQTVLKSTLTGASYLVYWLICFILTGLAIITAFLDVRALRGRVREEQRTLLESTLTQIETDAQKDAKTDRRAPK